MEKNLRNLVCLFLFSGSLSLSAQEGKKIPLPAASKKTLHTHSSNSAPANRQMDALTSCGTDTILYPYFKELMFNAPNDSFFVDAMVGNVRAASQAYVNTSSLSVLGVQFWGGAYTGGQSFKSIPVKVMLYAVNASFQPTLALDSATVTVNTNLDFYEAAFSNPYPLSSNFAVGVKNILNDTVSVITNNAGAAWQNPAFGEGLAWRRFGSGVWNSSASFFGQDLEYMIFPIVNYNMITSFTASSNSVCPNTQITFSNTSTNLLDNRMFNIHAFNDFWGLAAADSAYTWNYGINSAWTSTINGAYTYTSGGTYTTSLSAELLGYYNTCQDTTTLSITVWPSYNQTVSASICAGQSYTMGSQTYTAEGWYSQFMFSSYGCDSVVTLNLDVDTLNVTVTVNGASLSADIANASYQWINCANSATIAGETSQTFTAMTNGQYAVIVTFGACTDTSACSIVNTVGIRDPENLRSGISIHPNPSNGLTSINCNGFIANRIVIRNLMGQEIKAIQPGGPVVSLDLGELPAAVYLVDIEHGATVHTLRLMKQ
jgi:hypothetical protein